MNITSKKLTTEIQKTLRTGYGSSQIAHERTHADDAIVSMVVIGNHSQKHFDDTIKRITDGLTKSQYIENFSIVYKKNLYGNLLGDAIYVYTYNNVNEKKAMMRDTIAIEMEGVLLLQKEILDRKQKLVDDMNKLKEM